MALAAADLDAVDLGAPSLRCAARVDVPHTRTVIDGCVCYYIRIHVLHTYTHVTDGWMRSLAVCLSVQGGISAQAAAYADELDTMKRDMLRTNRLSADLVARAKVLDQWVEQNKAELSPPAVTVTLQSNLRLLLRMRAGIDAARKSELEDMSIYAVQYYGRIVVMGTTTHYDGQTRRSLLLGQPSGLLACARAPGSRMCFC